MATPPSTSTDGDEKNRGSSLPIMLAQAMALSANLQNQADELTADLQKKMPGAQATDAEQTSTTEGEFDLPQTIKRLQGDLKQAVAQLGGLAEKLGVAVPAGASAEVIQNALMASATSVLNQFALANGLPVQRTASAEDLSAMDFDIGKILKEKQAAYINAQKDTDALFTAHGIDPANPEAALAGLMPPPTAAAPLPPSGIPGAEKLSDMQAGTQRLNEILDQVKSKIVPG